jgi:accessory gene regulator B
MVYEKTVNKLNNYIVQELDLTAKEQGRIKFGIELLISIIMSLSTTLIVAKLLGIFNSVAFVLLAGAILRQSSGGIHFKTPWECAFFTAFFFNLIGYISFWAKESLFNNWILFLVLSSLYIIMSLLLWSPADVPEKPIKDQRQRRRLKLISLILAISLLILVALSFYFYQNSFALINISLILGLLLQVSAINPWAYKLCKLYYQVRMKLI